MFILSPTPFPNQPPQLYQLTHPSTQQIDNQELYAFGSDRWLQLGLGEAWAERGGPLVRRPQKVTTLPTAGNAGGVGGIAAGRRDGWTVYMESGTALHSSPRSPKTPSFHPHDRRRPQPLPGARRGLRSRSRSIWAARAGGTPARRRARQGAGPAPEDGPHRRARRRA